jgi:hypothetical protein
MNSAVQQSAASGQDAEVNDRSVEEISARGCRHVSRWPVEVEALVRRCMHPPPLSMSSHISHAPLRASVVDVVALGVLPAITRCRALPLHRRAALLPAIGPARWAGRPLRGGPRSPSCYAMHRHPRMKPCSKARRHGRVVRACESWAHRCGLRSPGPFRQAWQIGLRLIAADLGPGARGMATGCFALPLALHSSVHVERDSLQRPRRFAACTCETGGSSRFQAAERQPSGSAVCACRTTNTPAS